ncbi:hypothetical protein GCM10023310_17450 [Paenibacillus vulneris]|nr:DUF6508 domain-containing protein [Paenibacillus sp. 32352]
MQDHQPYKALLHFLPYFKSNSSKYALSDNGSWDPFLYDQTVLDFVKTISETQMLLQFDWMSWQAEANSYFDHIERIRTADMLVIRKLFTTIVRADRYNGGFYASMIDRGVIIALLEQLSSLLDKDERSFTAEQP